MPWNEDDTPARASRREFLLQSAKAGLAGALLAALPGCKSTAQRHGRQGAQGRRPNILWIQTDEHRCDSLSCYGAGWARTPAIAALAAGGVVFGRAFCNSPLCVPSRSSQLTGRYPQEVNTLENAVGWNHNVFPAGTVTFPEVFRAAGYETVSIGKYHTPEHPTWERNEHVYLRKDIADTSKLAPQYDPVKYCILRQPGRPRSGIEGGIYPEPEQNQSRIITDKAIAFLGQRQADRPFLLRVSHIWPHTPVLPPPPWNTIYRPQDIPIRFYDRQAMEGRAPYDRKRAEKGGWPQLTAAQQEQLWTDYMCLVAYVDHEVGRLLAALGEQGLEGNTIVLFSADHGKLLNEWGAVGKQTFDDVSWRIPFIVRWPGELPAGTRRSDLCSLLDTGRTLLGLAGLQAPATFRGRNLFSSDPAGNAVFGQISPPDAKAPVFTDPPLNDESSPPPGAGTAMRVAIRTERHRLDTVWMNASGEIPAAQRKGNLFDLEADPLEKRNLWDAPESRMLRDELQDRLASWFASLDRPHGLFGNIGKRPEGKPALSSGTT